MLPVRAAVLAVLALATGLVAVTAGPTRADRLLDNGLTAGSAKMDGLVVAYFSDGQPAIDMVVSEFGRLLPAAEEGRGLRLFDVIIFVHSPDALVDGRFNPAVFTFAKPELLADLQAQSSGDVPCDVFASTLSGGTSAGFIISRPARSSAAGLDPATQDCILRGVAAFAEAAPTTAKGN